MKKGPVPAKFGLESAEANSIPERARKKAMKELGVVAEPGSAGFVWRMSR